MTSAISNPPAPLVPPTLIAAAGERASLRFFVFAATIRNPLALRAYGRAVAEFLAWRDAHGASSIAAVQPLHVATRIEQQTLGH